MKKQHNPCMPYITTLCVALVLVAACGGSATGTTDTATDTTGTETTTDATETTGTELECVAVELEEDAMIDMSLGPMGDPANWAELPPGAVIASTYLRLGDSASQTAFDEVLDPIKAELMSVTGLLGLSLSGSASCGTARTLTVWADEEAMMDFVFGAAHLEAISRVSEISRGGSLTGSWPAGDFTDVNWATVAAKFEGHMGPEY